MSGPSQSYLDTLTRYYEEEVEGEAYFGAIAERMKTAGERRKMELLAEVEAYAADATKPLLEKHGLTPAPREELLATGRRQAAETKGDFTAFMAQWRREFPGYIDEFEALEAMAPAEDLAILKVLTDHEHAAIAFLEREAEGTPDSAAPLRHYLETGRA